MKFVLIFLAVFTTSAILAQTSSDIDRNSLNHKFRDEDRYWSLVGGIYANQYFGDLNEFAANKTVKLRDYYPGIRLAISRTFSRHFSFIGGFTWSRLAASDFKIDPDQEEMRAYTRNLSFRNDLLGLDFTVKYDLFSTLNNYLDRPVFTPYLFAGVGLAYSNPKGRIPEFANSNERFNDFGKWKSLRPLGTEGQFSDRYDVNPYSYAQLYFPFGIGASFKINEHWNINFDISYRYLTTDYIDDVSGQYVDLGIFDDPYALAFSDRSKEPNSPNGRYPRDFTLISDYTVSNRYQSEVDSNKSFEVWEGFGEEDYSRGDGSAKDFYLSMGFSLSYVITKKTNK